MLLIAPNLFLDGVDNQNSILSQGVPKNFECPRFKNPANGVAKCGGRLCLVKCHIGFMHGKGTAFVYRCNPKTGEWTTLPSGNTLPWPNCRSIPEVRLLFYASNKYISIKRFKFHHAGRLNRNLTIRLEKQKFTRTATKTENIFDGFLQDFQYSHYII